MRKLPKFDCKKIFRKILSGLDTSSCFLQTCPSPRGSNGHHWEGHISPEGRMDTDMGIRGSKVSTDLTQSRGGL